MKSEMRVHNIKYELATNKIEMIFVCAKDLKLFILSKLIS